MIFHCMFSVLSSDKLPGVHYGLFWLHRYGYHVTKASYFICYDQKIIKGLFDKLRNYDGKNNYPKTCGKFAVSGVRDLTTGYDSNQPDQKAVSSHVLLFYS